MLFAILALIDDDLVVQVDLLHRFMGYRKLLVAKIIHESTLKSGILGSRSNFAEYFFIQNYSYPVLPQIPIEFLKTEKSSQKTKN